MGDVMTFPESVEEFMEQYKMTDTEQVYSNGTEYVPIYRMRQWFENCRNQQRQTIDAIPVVRCQDCKHAWIHPCGYVYCHRDGRNAYEMTFNLDSFCSYGERKEGAE